jgi:hypothetical protein
MKFPLSCRTRCSDPAEEPCQKLWQAVLAGALKDLHASPPSAFDCQRHQREAQRWFLSPKTSVGSLNWICDVTNLDAETVRRYALSAPSGIPNQSKTSNPL